jgi:hypothetical protein
MSFSAKLRDRLAAVTSGQVELADSADAAIKAAFEREPDAVAVTADSAILRRVARGFDLVAWIAESHLGSAWIVSP